jgi:hypothetical protein
MGNARGLPVLNQRGAAYSLGGRPLLCKGFVVEVQDDLIIVRVSGTSYSASYYWTSSSTDLLALRLPMRDDHRAPMSRLEFIKSAWQLANDKAQALKWISPQR